MKKIYLILIALIVPLTSCGQSNVNYQQNQGSKFSHLSKNYPKQSSKKRVSPTESAKLGLPKGQYPLKSGASKSINFNKSYQANNGQEIANNYLTNDGEYVGHYKIGNPYEVFGVKYEPQQYDDFEEVGISSWYGDAFNGKKTANGEIYRKGDMTAAHPTLPLPSMVLVTNLKNGKSVRLRVNDRGPFSKKRVVDVSERAAIELGFKDVGTTTVKLEFLKEETEKLLRKLGISQ